MVSFGTLQFLFALVILIDLQQIENTIPYPIKTLLSPFQFASPALSQYYEYSLTNLSQRKFYPCEVINNIVEIQSRYLGNKNIYYMNSRILFVAFILSLCITAWSQTIIDIDIDKMYLHDGEIKFSSKGNLMNYDCFPKWQRINRDVGEICLSCEGKFELKEGMELIGERDILKFNILEEIIEWIKPLQFKREAKKGKLKDCTKCKKVYERSGSLIKYKNKNFINTIQHTIYPKYYPRLKVGSINYNVPVFIRINKKYFIIGILSRSGRKMKGFIIPTNDGGIIVWDKHEYYKDESIPFDSIGVTEILRPSYDFRKKEVGDGYRVYDKVLGNELLDESFDEVEFTNYWVITRKADKYSLYSAALDTIFMKDFQAIQSKGKITQGIKNNKIYFLDREGNFSDRYFQPPIAGCGVGYRSTKKKIRDYFFTYSETHEVISNMDTTKSSFMLTSSPLIQNLQFLNNNTLHKKGLSSYPKVFSFPENIYKCKIFGVDAIVSIQNSTFNRKHSYSNWKSRDYSNDRSNGTLGKTINFMTDGNIKLLFSGELQSFNSYHPVKFKDGNLFGYWPQATEARYTKLERFNFFFAKFELEDGRKGYLDINGKEYF